MTSTTIVTMFFNLKKLKDASMQTRPQEFYIENGRETLKLKYNMVINNYHTKRDNKHVRTKKYIFLLKNK